MLQCCKPDDTSTIEIYETFQPNSVLKIYIFQMKNILKTILLAGTVYFDYSNTIGIDIQS